MRVWEERSEQMVKDDVDALRQVLDPFDFKGIKNLYLDYYFKHYILKGMALNSQDVLFEIGCGRGRLSEFLAPSVSHVYGVDLIDHFIDICNDNPQKHKNTTYFKLADLGPLENVNKCFTVGVLMYFESDDVLIQTLRDYATQLPNVTHFYFVEQCEEHTKDKHSEGEFYARYRSVADYRKLFYKAGLGISKLTIMGERTHGPSLNAILRYRKLYEQLPLAFRALAPTLFQADRLFLNLQGRPITDHKPTDVLFQLEKI